MSSRRIAERLVGLGRTSDAVRALEEGLTKKDGEAALTLAHWRMAGDNLPRNIAEARRLFALAEEWGCRQAAAPLTALLASGAGGLARDWRTALKRFRSDAPRDDRIAEQCELIASMAIDDEGEPIADFEPEFLSHDPLVVRFPALLSPRECDAVIAMAKPRLSTAKVVDPATGVQIRDPIRDSSTAAFPFLDENPFLHAINRRIAAASRSRVEQGEPTQILFYRKGQQYKLHSDGITGAVNQRIQTLLVYLTDDFEGGATYFPYGDLAFRFPRGDAICFSNVSSDMRPSANARHAGLPVSRGIKIVLSKWIRQTPLDLR